jgi:hypothetical protein
MELYTLWPIDYPHVHTSHYPLLSLVKYHKPLLGYHLCLGSNDIFDY